LGGVGVELVGDDHGEVADGVVGEAFVGRGVQEPDQVDQGGAGDAVVVAVLTHRYRVCAER
jgi:hypothetical protein